MANRTFTSSELELIQRALETSQIADGIKGTEQSSQFIDTMKESSNVPKIAQLYKMESNTRDSYDGISRQSADENVLRTMTVPGIPARSLPPLSLAAISRICLSPMPYTRMSAFASTRIDRLTPLSHQS